MTRTLLLGHRGARAAQSIPENTFASFDRALAAGCDGFEFDVRLTVDGHAVVCHDPKVGRLVIAGASARQLPSLPRLPDVLERYRNAFLDIELKVPGLEGIVVQTLHKCQPREFIVSSFMPAVLGTLHAANPAIPLGLICETKTQLYRWNQLPLEYLIVERRLVRRDLVLELQGSGRRILAWTVNSSAEMKRFAAWGVDGIISDNTKLLGATLR